MRLSRKLKEISKLIKNELFLYSQIMKDPRTPLLPKILLWLAIAYLLMPFDLIPDFIPVIGHVDDAIIIPLLVYFALKFIPEEIIAEYRSTEYEYN